MTDPRKISIQDYTYYLPKEKIALYPTKQRGDAKLLIYKNRVIKEDIYKTIDNYISEKSLLIFNNTKVINARIQFTKSTGGIIEIFCLEPFGNNNEYSSVMNKRTQVCWKCMIKGADKWKEEFLTKQLTIDNVQLVIHAKLIDKLKDSYIIQFYWGPANFTFAEVINHAGSIPLPPYIKRNAEKNDSNRYQTIYAKYQGSVAAPTAGLHFTDEIFKKLKDKKIQTTFATLHVGAGTFKPVKTLTIEEHKMHAEWIDVPAKLIKELLTNLSNPIIAVGTTSLRTIESIYWMGVKAFLRPFTTVLQIDQWEVYSPSLSKSNISVKTALEALSDWLKKNNLNRLFTQTKILIAPGYNFKVATALITNFHQPQSTLLLLIAAAVGNDWKKIYDYALKNNFRFLSYGDGSLLFINKL